MERIPHQQQFSPLHQSQVHPGLSPYHHPGYPQLNPFEHPTHIAQHPAALYGGQVGRHKKPRKNKYRQHEVIEAPVTASYPGPQLYETNPLPPAPVPVEHSPYHFQVAHPEHAYGPGFQHAGHPLVNGGYLEFHGSKPTYPNVHGFVPRARDHHGWGGQGAQGHHRGVITGYPNAKANYTSKRV